MENQGLSELLKEIRSCRICEKYLPLGPRPVLDAKENSEIVIIGQAPGTRVHETGIPWNDPSGEKLREWLDMDKETFYDSDRIAIVPMGFCYPGKGKSGDLPPRPECEEAWHSRLFQHLPNLKLKILAGSYAIKSNLKEAASPTLTETIRNFETHLENGIFPLVHPSPRNRRWLKRNPWFEEDVVPRLREEVWKVLDK